ncbi:MAG TPA: hypothetical protein VEK76_08330 [Candidatus Binatia bacterium]|nr:hypothetical protein [Candidatus Binatia bacterium]
MVLRACLDVAAPSDPRYDLVHVRTATGAPGHRSGVSLFRFEFEFMGESLSLEDARSRRRSLDRHGITALIVPERYREPALSAGEARSRAEEAVREEKKVGRSSRVGGLRLHAEHPMFFTFLAPDAEAKRAEGSSGRLITVDRCDGHLWSDEETTAYFSLVGPR